jgi:hypothetical protein
MNMMPAVSYVQTGKSAELGFLFEKGERPGWGQAGGAGYWAFTNQLPVFDPLND